MTLFFGIKRDKPSFRPGHNFFKIQIDKFSSGIWVFNNYKQAGIISKKTNIGSNIRYNVVNKKKKKKRTKNRTLRNTSSYKFLC